MTTHDGLKLHTKAWTISDPKADILLAHGFFEHCERYSAETKFLNEAGYSVYSYDQRTHGKSEGNRRSYVSNFENYSKDYKSYLHKLELGKVRPYYLFAHSMGGLVLATYLVNEPKLGDNFMGAIFSAPLILPDKEIAPFLQKISGLIGTLFPTLKVVKIDSTVISRDPQEILKYNNDPLVYTDKMYASSAYKLLKQMKKIQPQLSNISCPILIMHGTDDKLVEIDGSRLLYSKVISEDKELKEFIDYKHEITRDLGKEKVLEHMKNWMDERL